MAIDPSNRINLSRFQNIQRTLPPFQPGTGIETTVSHLNPYNNSFPFPEGQRQEQRNTCYALSLWAGRPNPMDEAVNGNVCHIGDGEPPAQNDGYLELVRLAEEKTLPIVSQTLEREFARVNTEEMRLRVAECLENLVVLPNSELRKELQARLTEPDRPVSQSLKEQFTFQLAERMMHAWVSALQLTLARRTEIELDAQLTPRVEMNRIEEDIWVEFRRSYRSSVITSEEAHQIWEGIAEELFSKGTWMLVKEHITLVKGRLSDSGKVRTLIARRS